MLSSANDGSTLVLRDVKAAILRMGCDGEDRYLHISVAGAHTNIQACICESRSLKEILRELEILFPRHEKRIR